MLRLPESVRAWGTPQFEAALKTELQRQVAQLPLQQGLAASSSVADGTPPVVMILGVSGDDGRLRVKLGIAYAGVVGGCSCADDPTPQSENAEYCEMLLEIDRASAAATVMLL